MSLGDKMVYLHLFTTKISILEFNNNKKAISIVSIILHHPVDVVFKNSNTQVKYINLKFNKYNIKFK